MIQSKLDRVVGTVHEAVKPVTELAKNTLADLNQALTQISQTLNEIPKNEDLKTAAVTAASQLTQVAVSCGNLQIEAEKAVAGLTAITVGAITITNDLSGVQKKVADLSTALQSLGKDANKVNTTIKEVVHFVQSELGEAR
jgi:hypothetical protein